MLRRKNINAKYTWFVLKELKRLVWSGSFTKIKLANFLPITFSSLKGWDRPRYNTPSSYRSPCCHGLIHHRQTTLLRSVFSPGAGPFNTGLVWKQRGNLIIIEHLPIFTECWKVWKAVSRDISNVSVVSSRWMWWHCVCTYSMVDLIHNMALEWLDH